MPERLGVILTELTKLFDLHRPDALAIEAWETRVLVGKHPDDPDKLKSAPVPQEIVEKVLYLRKTYHLGPMRIVWYLARYHDIKISGAGVSRILKRNGLNRLPRGTRLRKVHTTRYQQQVPGHQIQVDVKFLIFPGKDGKPIKRYQYTAIDDATRVRALKVYSRHTQANAIDFLDYVIKSFPFRIREVRTDNGHEFQAKFHWHVEDQGISHAYIKPRSP